MDWWLVIAVGLVAALVYGYWSHTRDSRHLAKLFALLAAKYRGRVRAAGLFALPQLHFELDGQKVLVTAMASSGSGGPDSGPFTLVNLELADDSGAKIRVQRGRDLTKALVDAVAPSRQAVTGHEVFDQAYQIDGGDQALVDRLLDLRVRGRLLDSRLARLSMRLDGRSLSVHMDGVADSAADLEEMIEIATLLADRCPVGD